MVGVARPKNEEWSSPFQEGNIGGDKTHSGVFPRSHDSHGYNLPKVHHALAKMPDYICEFRTGMNFYSGPGEASHKWFVKAPGLKMQQHVSEFATQTADQYYSMMTIAKATWFVDIRSTRREHKTKPLMHVMKPQYAVMGQYSVYIVPNETIRLKCTKTNKHVKKVGLDERLVGVMISAIELLDTLVQKCMVMKVRWTNTMHIHFTTVQNGTIVTTHNTIAILPFKNSGIHPAWEWSPSSSSVFCETNSMVDVGAEVYLFIWIMFGAWRGTDSANVITSIGPTMCCERLWGNWEQVLVSPTERTMEWIFCKICNKSKWLN